MGRTACTEPQCLYKGALYLHLTFKFCCTQVKVLCVLSTITCKVSSANTVLEFVVMVAGPKIVHDCITVLVLYCLRMLWIKTVTAKFQYLGSLHYQLWKSCVHLYMGFTTPLHPVYYLNTLRMGLLNCLIACSRG